MQRTNMKRNNVVGLPGSSASSSREQRFIPADDDEEEEIFESKKSKMNSLDSDEEDELETERDKYNVAGVENKMFDGQEKSTVDFDGDIKITAFNMEEEMQDGHFDKEGTFIFKKEKEMVKDSWLDNIDWVKIKESEQKKDPAPRGLADSSDSEDSSGAEPDTKDLYSKMIEMMQPGENVLKCIKRLGGGAAKNKRDRRKLDAEQQATLDKMIGFANDVLSSGDMDIYQRTYEQLKFALAPKDKSDNMDMFADEDVTATDNDEPSTSTLSTKPPPVGVNQDQDVLWEYKWEDKEEAPIYGPYSSQDMLQWSQSGYFGDGVFVRRRSEPKFYSSKRIDFDLYI